MKNGSRHLKTTDDADLSDLSTVTERSTSNISISDNISVTTHNEPDTNHVPVSRISESTWTNFSIPWKNMSRKVTEDCERGDRINKESYNTVVHTVIDYMRDIKTYSPTKAFQSVAKYIVKKCPGMFLDKDEDGVIVREGHYSLYHKLVDRNNYLNRPHKRTTSSQVISPKERKLTLLSKAGCSNWQPDEVHNDPETLEEKKEVLRNLANQNFIFDKIKHLAEETYVTQRLFLNNPKSPSIAQIRNEWPLLLKQDMVYWHYEKLMGHSIHNLKEAFNTKTNQILTFGLLKKYVQTLPVDETDMQLAVLKILGKYFKEDIKTLLVHQSDTVENVESAVIGNFPCIILCSPIDSDSVCNKFIIVIEKQRVAEFINFMEALEYLFAMYYNFNMAYPKETARSLEFIQRYMLKIHPDQGTKIRKTHQKFKLYPLLTGYET